MSQDLDFQYSGWDVHAWTPIMRKLVLHYPQLNIPLSLKETYLLIKDIFQVFPGQKKILKKFYQRATREEDNGDYLDPDLNIYVMALLKLLWTKVKRRGPEMYQIFEETLEEIGETCIQGDSHRMLMLLSAVVGK